MAKQQKSHAAKQTRQYTKMVHNSEAKARKALLSELPGQTLNLKEFKSMIGHALDKSNQIKSIKDLSANLQNIFRLNSTKTGFNCKYFSGKSFNTHTSKIEENTSLSIFTLNIRSLNRNSNELNILLSQLTLKFDFLCLTEIWDSNLTFMAKIFPGYKCKYVPPKSSKCGGVALFYRQNYKVEINNDLQLNSNKDDIIDVDEIWLNTETENGIKSTIGVIYRHPKANITKFNDKFYSVLDKINSDKSIEMCFIAGDFNVNLINYDTHKPTETFLDNFISNSFLPSIHLPTRITYKSSTLIDNIFVLQKKTKKFQNISSGSFYADITDHLPCFLIIDYPTKIPKQSRPKIRVYNELSKQNFITDLQKVDWSSVYNDENPDSSFKTFLDIYKNLHEKNFPLQTLSRKKSKQNPWMTKEINKMRITRDKNRKKVTQGLLDEKEYKEQKNKTRKMIRQAQEDYYKDLFDEKQNGMKQMWKHLGSILNPKRTNGPHKILHLFANNTSITENSEIAETLNQHFCSIGDKLASKIPKAKKSFKSYLKSSPPNSFFFKKIDPKQVLNIISALQVQKSPGIDGIPNKALKISAEVIVTPLTHIINHSLSKGVFPECLKTAKVIPLFKKGDETLCSNYRPISLLSCFHKLFEKVMKSKLLEYLDENNVLYKYQFGFRKTHSTNLALLEVTEQLYANLDVDNYGLGIYLDFQKAFDTVNHEILLDKLYHYGIRGNILDWFKSYLKNRKQFTFINGVNSQTSHIECGVPQGSVLGPLLFLIYVNDIQHAFTHASPKLFADDINLFIFHKDLKTLYSLANTELESLNTWLLANKLSLSIGENKDTKYTLFSPKSYPDIDKLPFLYISGQLVPYTTVIKYLGVHLDHKLTFKDHIDKLKEKINKYVGIFYHIRHKLPPKCRRVLYFSFVFSYLYYCAEIYGNATKATLNPLQIVQNRILRTLQYKDKYFPINKMHKSYGILKLQDMIQYKQSKIIHSLLTGAKKLPSVLKKLIVPLKNIHSHNTRNKNLVYEVKPRHPIGGRLLKSNASKVWNRLPKNIILQETHGEFKNEFYNFKLSSYKESTLNFAPNMY